MTTRNTPEAEWGAECQAPHPGHSSGHCEAALAAALERHHDSGGFCGYCSSERAFEPWPCDAGCAREEIVRLQDRIRELERQVIRDD